MFCHFVQWGYSQQTNKARKKTFTADELFVAFIQMIYFIIFYRSTENKMRLLKLILTTLLTCTSFTTSERILALFYHPGPSHFFSFYPLFDALAERGHHVTALTYTSVKNHHKNYNELILEGIPVVNNSITYDEMVIYK